MHKMTVTYKDFRDREMTKDFYFNLEEHEAIELQFSKPEGYDEYARNILATEEFELIWPLFKDLVLRTYGKPVETDLGVIHSKTPEIVQELVDSAAFSKIYLGLATNATMAAEFFNGVVPKYEDTVTGKAAKEAGIVVPQDYQRKQSIRPTEEVSLPEPVLAAVEEKGLEDYTGIELMEMDPEQLEKLREDYAVRKNTTE